jgi:hypothetical protein
MSDSWYSELNLAAADIMRDFTGLDSTTSSSRSDSPSPPDAKWYQDNAELDYWVINILHRGLLIPEGLVASIKKIKEEIYNASWFYGFRLPEEKDELRRLVTKLRERVAEEHSQLAQRWRNEIESVAPGLFAKALTEHFLYTARGL